MTDAFNGIAYKIRPTFTQPFLGEMLQLADLTLWELRTELSFDI